VLISLQFRCGGGDTHTRVYTFSEHGKHKILTDEFYVSTTSFIVTVAASSRELIAYTGKRRDTFLRSTVLLSH